MTTEMSAEIPSETTGKAKRAPRKNYGFAENAVITLTGKEAKYRSKRRAWFDSIVPYEGQTVKAWMESRKDQADSPRGWLRFFVQDGTVSLVSPS